VVAELISRITPHISIDRLESYRPLQPTPGTDRDMLVTYLFNLALCEALYTPLSLLEISLRNTLHTNLSALYGSPAWYKIPGVLQPYQVGDITKVEAKIVRQQKTVTVPRVISELKFGFWTSLLSKDYDGLWRARWATLLKSSFPEIPRSVRQRNNVYHRYNDIRELRNRVFHHEAIWSRFTLESDHECILEAIGWVNSEMFDACKLVDRFEDVFKSGRANIERKLTDRYPAP